ncbi:uncharacterized protein [Blastocystis hominis]|uniref:Uncharacterized protein n=1 Tax=Blastocystis hominis TaxID=12968 RepID=D8LYU6_BLAHO|nr:uncharacterized protein [Blastocystis hominis]CBK20751.2 unnamed protein product [Blastocystis hominis]|eukprot:XP_012894799.1 uncharacterized protein [Blastocystis hominis]
MVFVGDTVISEKPITIDELSDFIVDYDDVYRHKERSMMLIIDWSIWEVRRMADAMVLERQFTQIF